MCPCANPSAVLLGGADLAVFTAIQHRTGSAQAAVASTTPGTLPPLELNSVGVMTGQQHWYHPTYVHMQLHPLPPTPLSPDELTFTHGCVHVGTTTIGQLPWACVVSVGDGHLSGGQDVQP